MSFIRTGAWQRALAESPTEHVIALRHPRSLYRDFILRAVPAPICMTDIESAATAAAMREVRTALP